MGLGFYEEFKKVEKAKKHNKHNRSTKFVNLFFVFGSSYHNTQSKVTLISKW